MTGGQHTDQTVARRRFEAELGAFEAEFEALTSEMSATEQPTWVSRGQALLEAAQDALAEDDIEQGWVYLHTAQRLTVHRFDPDTDTDALRGEARELLVEAKESGLGWRARAVQRRLAADDGSAREGIGIPDIQSATKLLHKGYEGLHLKRRHLQSQVRYLALGAAAGIILIIAASLLSVVAVGMPSPFFDFTAATVPTPDAVVGNNTTATLTPQSRTGANNTTATASPTPTGTPAATPPAESNQTASSPPRNNSGGGQPASVGFLVYILLFGILGAALFGIRSVRKRPSSTTTPQYLSSQQAAMIRLLVGAASALAVFFFVTSGILDISVGADDSNGPFLITLAFVAGYSERLVHDTVEAVASTAVPESSDSNSE